MKKFRQLLKNFLRVLLEKLNRADNTSEYNQRLDIVRSFFHETLPHLDEKWMGKAIIEGGKFNYFQLPNGELPKYDFAMPEIPLYVVVSDISSADWSQARERGITRDAWEQSQENLTYLEQLTPSLATIGMAAQPRILIIRWNDPINNFKLAERLQEISK